MQMHRHEHAGCTKSSTVYFGGYSIIPYIILCEQCVRSLKFIVSGQPSWGIAWYINDLLIPEIYVERGQTYTFIVEGGNDRTNPARYHPFYITDSPEGGFGQKSEAEQKKQRVFGGVGYDAEGYPYPTAGMIM